MRFSEWLEQRDPGLLLEMQRRSFLKSLVGIAATPLLAKVPRKIMDIGMDMFTGKIDLKPEDLAAHKRVNILSILKKSVHNPEKFMRDFENLKSPGSDDIGMATRKEMLDRDIDLYVVTDKYMKEKRSNSLSDSESQATGFADIGTDRRGGMFVVMPERLFAELPSSTSDGVLAKLGIETLVHELRHTTQNRDKIPISRYFQSTEDSYMWHPAEMGVRLASAKNIADRDYILNFANRKLKLNWEGNGVKISHPQAMSLLSSLLPKEDKDIFVLLMNPELIRRNLENLPEYKKIVEQIKDRNMVGSFAGNILKPLDGGENSIQSSDSDFESLFEYYKKLNPSKKIQYMQELKHAFDTVVHGGSSREKVMA